MEYVVAGDKRFLCDTDSKTIQAAVDYASSSGICEVVIPRINPRTGKPLWEIEKAVLLPSEMTVILNNAHLRMADGVYENVFRNKNAWSPFGNTMEGEQHDIRITGTGHAVIDGGKLNGLCEQLRRDHPERYPSMYVNLSVFFHNVRNFEVSNIHFINTRWWALCFMFCRFGKISDLNFSNHATMENQDGIDLRVGCEYITIQNITGITGDDTVALTALPEGGIESSLAVAGKTPDIHDITIQNIISSSHGCGIVRFLCEDGAREYNITVDGVKDTGRSICAAAFIMGTANTRFVKKHARRMGEFSNITIRNVTTTAQRAVTIAEPCENLLIENVSTFGKNEVGIQFAPNFEAKNVIIRNFYYNSDPQYADCLFWSNKDEGEGCGDLHVEHIRVASEPKYIFRRFRHEIKDIEFGKYQICEYTDEKASLCSAYGRYFRDFFGEEIKNRPKDNRFDGTTEEDAF